MRSLTEIHVNFVAKNAVSQTLTIQELEEATEADLEMHELRKWKKKLASESTMNRYYKLRADLCIAANSS